MAGAMPDRTRVVTGGTPDDPDTVYAAPVRGSRNLDRFIRLPWKLYADDPAWIPPLIMEQRKVLDREKHPFHEHADVEYFLAWRGPEVVGRVAAIINHRYNEFHGTEIGHFGFFESIEDAVVARTLLDAAETWLHERGMHRVEGPFNFSTNDESHSPGILMDGFEHPPFLLMGHARPYYGELVEGAGYEKVMDLLAYWLASNQPPDRLIRGVQRTERAIPGLEIRHLDLKRLDEEVEVIQDIYNSAWEKNWAFVPLTENEIEHLAADLKPIVEPRLCFIAYMDGRPAGFSLTLPNFNQVLRHLDGKLFPFGIFKLFWHRRKIDHARVFTLGLKPDYRGIGLDAILYLKTFLAGQELGIGAGECSWILEDNWPMRRGMEKMEGKVYKTYRVYGKDLRGD